MQMRRAQAIVARRGRPPSVFHAVQPQLQLLAAQRKLLEFRRALDGGCLELVELGGDGGALRTASACRRRTQVGQMAHVCGQDRLGWDAASDVATTMRASGSNSPVSTLPPRAPTTNTMTSVAMSEG
jgi:hypothetical protein